jgi:hypothetical protein
MAIIRDVQDEEGDLRVGLIESWKVRAMPERTCVKLGS